MVARSGYQTGPQGIRIAPLDYAPFPDGASTTTSADTIETTTAQVVTPSSPADGADLQVTSVAGWTAPPASTLSTDLAAEETSSLTLADASGFDASGEIKIGAERIWYGAKTSNTLTDLTRGVGGTTAAAHATSAAVAQPRAARIGAEVILFHGLDAVSSPNLVEDVIRTSPLDHVSGAVIAPQGESLTITSGTGWPTSGGRFSIASEVLLYTSRSGTTLSGVQRGTAGTVPASHASGSTAVVVPYGAASLSNTQTFAPISFENVGGTDLEVGALAKPASGGGVEALTEGDAAAVIAISGAEAGTWGTFAVGGFASFSLVSAGSTPNRGEPVFASTSTTVKALADADPGDVAVGTCLAVHTVDELGNVLTDPRVDVLLSSSFFHAYTA